MKRTLIILLGLILLVGGCMESFTDGLFQGYNHPGYYRPYRGISNDMLYQQQMEGLRHYNEMMRDMNNRFSESINQQSLKYGY